MVLINVEKYFRVLAGHAAANESKKKQNNWALILSGMITLKISTQVLQVLYSMRIAAKKNSMNL